MLVIQNITKRNIPMLEAISLNSRMIQYLGRFITGKNVLASSKITRFAERKRRIRTSAALRTVICLTNCGSSLGRFAKMSNIES
jgi:hypothetical protein